MDAAGLHKLRGMFAFALHDQRTGKMLIARDRLGVKPLYYIDTPELFAFASEIKSLLQIPQVKRTVDYKALMQILALKYTCDDSTLFAGIKKLEPGHYLEYDRGTVSIVRYWDCAHIKVDDSITEADAVKQMRQLMDTSINLRLMADVPLGMFLSGGIDSTIISERMSKMVDRRIATFSVAFGEREANELHYARIAAKHADADPARSYHDDEGVFPTTAADDLSRR